MQNLPATPPPIPAPGEMPAPSKTARRNQVTWKLLFIAALILILQIPLQLVNSLQQERRATWGSGAPTSVVAARPADRGLAPVAGGFEAYRMVERALKHSVLVLALVFAAFFLFETLAGLRLHAVHYGLVGAAMCFFYLALLALGEVAEPAVAYVGAAGASSVLVVLYAAAILQSRGRAGVIGAVLVSVHSVLFVVLQMEHFALLAGTGALFAALAAVMFFTRNIDWYAQEAGSPAVAR